MRILALPLLAAMSLSPTICLAAGGGAVESQPKPTAVSGFDRANLDPTSKPCDDFNTYANGGWISKNPIPAEYPSWGTFSALRDRNLDAVHTILESAAKNTNAAKGSSEQKIGDYYYTFLDTKTRDTAGLKPLAPWFDRIGAIKNSADLQATIAYLQTYNIDAAFGIGSLPDFKNSKMAIAIVGQGGLGLPDRDYYFKDDDRSKQIREQYVAHVAKMFELMGDDAARAQASAKTVMAIETRFAGASLTNVELRDPSKSYNIMDAAQRKALTPNFDWDSYLSEVGQPGITTMNVAHPKFFTEFNAMLTSVPLDDWKVYLRWRIVDNLADALSSEIELENFKFNGTVLAGTKEQSPLWKRGVRATNGALGEAVGQVYVKEYFPPESKRRMKELVKNLELALRDDIKTLEWMSDDTRKQALAKLDAFTDKIGYPDKWIDYSTLDVDRGPYVTNAIRARNFAFKRDINKVNKPVDRGDWQMTPQTVNAQYNPFNNDITFPAGILQPPFFNPEADDAINYGAIGAVIGHEMTHGFDDQGSQFDAEGNLKNWWTEADLAKFKARAKCVEDLFTSYTLPDGTTHLNGKLVNGESIADLGGLKIAWAAYQKSLEGKPKPADIDGFTNEQRFFLGYAQVWAATATPQFELLQTNTNEHPLPRYRLMGTVSNMAEFQKAFGCKSGDKMVRADACTIW